MDTRKRWDLRRVKGGLYSAATYATKPFRYDPDLRQKQKEINLNPDGVTTLHILLEKWRRALKVASRRSWLGRDFEFGDELLWKQTEYIMRDEHATKSPDGTLPLTKDALAMFAALKRAKIGQRRHSQEWAFDNIIVLIQNDGTYLSPVEQVLRWGDLGLKVNPNVVAGNSRVQPGPCDIDGFYCIWDGIHQEHKSIRKSFKEQQMPHDISEAFHNDGQTQGAKNWKAEHFEQAYVSNKISDMYLYSAYGYHSIYVAPNRKVQSAHSSRYLNKYSVGQYYSSLSDLCSWSPQPLINRSELQERYRQFVQQTSKVYSNLKGGQVRAIMQELEH
ncbi:MAG: hypothetical protein Q9159_002288 [Coniocarpon cinnabarinum]